ncbi:glutamine amidotransferase [Naegleria gruberi]|uniref:GMP synthase [glutamine-hydrolyzing] n=1 Tax=Naegleria gruberi TaxID=5762 RepID=D2VQZ1_NAEGR|nr:glutamine amidotransferase [Naegleria gruberi]EFC40722.1 glutamine amidotransferase [Naegleria gruberi]|eukprot:XP_002673466.1 glutamine amidotransferase [Naegleria gruberi strain NEG-M]
MSQQPQLPSSYEDNNIATSTSNDKVTNLELTHEKIIIIDFGSQYTQLIGRKVRELNVYCEIYPYDKFNENTLKVSSGGENAEQDGWSFVRGVILSGSHHSVHDEHSPRVNEQVWNEIHKRQIPILGICFGAQMLAHLYGEQVVSSVIREYGRAHIQLTSNNEDTILSQLSGDSQVWMSHGDSILIKEEGSQLEIIAKSDSIPVAAFKVKGKKIFGVQFHPEVHHSHCGKLILSNFLKLAGCSCTWTPSHFIDETVKNLKQTIGESDHVVMALSGGVDSSVAAVLLQKAIGDRLHCIFVDNGLLRLNEFEQVLETYRDSLHLNVKGVEVSTLFYDALKGESDPEKKRKIIGAKFIEVFEKEAQQISNVKHLGQGTIYPDVVESIGGATIKSHHNVGGLPEKMHMKVVEPLRLLFKDEVRRVGKELGIPDNILLRHPFPGPGLGIRILGDITAEKVELLQKVDAIYVNSLKEEGLYNQIWQAGAILLPIHSVGVQGDGRTYEKVVALRAVTSVDGMTADIFHFPWEFLGKVSNKIINQVKGVNRVVYDISTKPPSTIEWE